MPHSFTRLDQVTDQVHALFDAWAEAGTFASVLGEDGIEVLRLAVHEWIANLVQHATFPGPPHIELAVEIDGDGVRCTIEDSSVGFDLATQIERQQTILDAPAPSERGRGLLMLVTSTDDLSYRAASATTRQRVSFVVHNPGEDFFAALFRPEDLAADPSFARSMGDGQVGDDLPHPASGGDDR